MAEGEKTFRDVENLFGKIAEKVAGMDYETVRNNMYTFLHVLTAILLEVKHGSEPGWATKITLPNGDPAFEVDDAKQVEEMAKQLSEAFTFTQSGGGGLLDGAKAKLSENPAGMAADIIEQASQYVDPDKISVDAAFTNLTNYLDRLDLQNRQIARLIGPVAFTSELKKDPSIPNPFFPEIPIDRFRIPARSIIPFINTILEIVRILVALSPIQFPFIRSALSLGMAIFDTLNGEWRHGVLSLLGIFGNKPMYIGIMLKVVRNAWLLIEPQLAKQLRLDIFKAGKSMTIGLVLWAFATFSPDFIRNPIESGVGRFRSMIDRINEQLGVFQAQANAAAGPLGIEVIFPTIPTELVPTFADIQNLQTVVQQPEIYCNADIRAILEPMRYVPPLRFILEMLNIPMVPELVAASCKGVDTSNLSHELAQKLQPQILVNGIPLSGAPAPGPPYPPKETMMENARAKLATMDPMQMAAITSGGQAALQPLTAPYSGPANEDPH